jgi:hypothetical protein
MTTLNTIKNLVSKLKREELKSLLKYLRYYQDGSGDSKGKGVQLIEAVINEPGCTQKEVQLSLYGKENYHAFNKLLNRTKDKIYEVLLFDQNLSKHYYSERNRVVFEIRKKLLQSEVLYFRGMTDDLNSFQNKIISRAKEYEIYDSLIEALQAKQRYLGFRFGIKAQKVIEGDIVFFEECRVALQKARSAFNNIGVKINQSTTSDDYKEELKQLLDILQKDYMKTKSSRIRYYYLFLKTEWMHIQNDYRSAELTLQSLFELITDNVSLHNRILKADILMNLSNNEIYLGQFPLAIQNILEAKSLYDLDSVNYDMASEIEFNAYFYGGDFSKSEELIEKIYHSSRTAQTPFLFSKRAYLFACLKTIKGEIENSNELLNEVKEIQKDKEGWNLHIRILKIINRIELNDLESADLKVLSLEKFIKRILKFRHVRKRDILILRILLKLINEGFDFKKVYKQRRRYFDLLESEDPDYGWKIKSPELIVFHEWFKKKLIKSHSATQ